jgi:alpha-L-arabinofuranosidase
VDYLNGPVTTEWGRRRAENGHPEPYGIRYIEIGNEEAISGKSAEYAHYLERFKLLYEAMRPRDARLQFIIAAWWKPEEPIVRQIVQELSGKAALWDVHVGGDGLRDGDDADALFTRMRKLFQEWAPDTSLKACVLEENGGRHDLQRALGHAHILNAAQRHGDFILMDCPANCLQPWRQNDNGWDQGQVFFTSGQVWAMPPFYAQQMAAANHLPCRVAGEVTSPRNELDVTTTRSEDGSTLVLKVVNIGAKAHRAAIDITGLGPLAPRADVWTLTGKPCDINTPDAPDRVRSHRTHLDGVGNRFQHEFPGYSYSILRMRK